jgi:hypothetical protein
MKPDGDNREFLLKGKAQYSNAVRCSSSMLSPGKLCCQGSTQLAPIPLTLLCYQVFGANFIFVVS